jgi:hypothetical protein
MHNKILLAQSENTFKKYIKKCVMQTYCSKCYPTYYKIAYGYCKVEQRIHNATQFKNVFETTIFHKVKSKEQKS